MVRLYRPLVALTVLAVAIRLWLSRAVAPSGNQDAGAREPV